MREAEVGDATTYIYIMTDADGNETRINGIDTVVSEYADGCQQIEPSTPTAPRSTGRPRGTTRDSP